MGLPKSLAWLVVVSGVLHITLSTPLKDANTPHVIKKRDSIEDFYWNENLPLGFFINSGGEGGENGVQAAAARSALFDGSGEGSVPATAFGRSGIPGLPKEQFYARK